MKWFKMVLRLMFEHMLGIPNFVVIWKHAKRILLGNLQRTLRFVSAFPELQRRIRERGHHQIASPLTCSLERPNGKKLVEKMIHLSESSSCFSKEKPRGKRNTRSPLPSFCQFGNLKSYQQTTAPNPYRRMSPRVVRQNYLHGSRIWGTPKKTKAWGNANRFPFNASCLISLRNVPYMNLNIGYNIWYSKHTVDHIRSRMANKQPAQATADPEKQEVQGHCGRGCWLPDCHWIWHRTSVRRCDKVNVIDKVGCFLLRCHLISGFSRLVNYCVGVYWNSSTEKRNIVAL